MGHVARLSYGRIEVLEWVRFQRLAVDVAACRVGAYRKQRPRVLEWLAANY